VQTSATLLYVIEHQEGASLLELDLVDDAALLCDTFDADPGLLDLSLNASFEADKDIQEPKGKANVTAAVGCLFAGGRPHILGAAQKYRVLLL
jgi:hypothetical protein